MVNYRAVLIDIVNSEKGGKFLEIGVLKGKTCRAILHYCSEIITEYWAVDPWAVVEDTRRRHWSQQRWDKYYLYVVRLMLIYKKLRVVRATSMEFFAIANGLKEYFDIGFIDGNHAYEVAKEDMVCWKNLIRKGGLLTGHDYSKRFPGVVRAVDEVFGSAAEIFPGAIWAVRI